MPIPIISIPFHWIAIRKHSYRPMIYELIYGIQKWQIKVLVGGLRRRTTSSASRLDIVDIKPPNMEDLTEVITGAEFHPRECNLFVYSSSRGIIRLCDMRQSALCDRHCKGQWRDEETDLCIDFAFGTFSFRRTWRSEHTQFLLGDYFLDKRH